ncbi:transporter [Clostridia bacterium]|nr:transporter [Clostridia bacterium]
MLFQHLCSSYKSFQEDKMNVYTASTAFFLILSIFPLIMLLLNLLQFTSLQQAEFIRILEDVVPRSILPLIKQIVEDMYAKSSRTLLSVSALTALWSASNGVLEIEKGLLFVFHSKQKRPYILRRLFGILYTLIFLVVIVLSLFLLVFGNQWQIFLAKHIPVIHDISLIVVGVRTLIVIFLLLFFFLILYHFFPKAKGNILKQLPGAIFSTIGWLVFSFLFSIYIDNFSNYKHMYGNLALMIIFMLWLYFCLYIMFLGAEINYQLEMNSARRSMYPPRVITLK